jgi:hypothetical protein
MAGIGSVGRQFELAPTWAASLMIPRKEYGGAVTTRKPIREMGRASHHHNDFIGDARSQIHKSNVPFPHGTIPRTPPPTCSGRRFLCCQLAYCHPRHVQAGSIAV